MNLPIPLGAPRKRAAFSCLECRKNKIKCAGLPATADEHKAPEVRCTRCVKHDKECQIAPSRRKGRPRRLCKEPVVSAPQSEGSSLGTPVRSYSVSSETFSLESLSPMVPSVPLPNTPRASVGASSPLLDFFDPYFGNKPSGPTPGFFTPFNTKLCPESLFLPKQSPVPAGLASPIYKTPESIPEMYLDQDLSTDDHYAKCLAFSTRYSGGMYALLPVFSHHDFDVDDPTKLANHLMLSSPLLISSICFWLNPGFNDFALPVKGFDPTYEGFLIALFTAIGFYGRDRNDLACTMLRGLIDHMMNSGWSVIDCTDTPKPAEEIIHYERMRAIFHQVLFFEGLVGVLSAEHLFTLTDSLYFVNYPDNHGPTSPYGLKMRAMQTLVKAGRQYGYETPQAQADRINDIHREIVYLKSEIQAYYKRNESFAETTIDPRSLAKNLVVPSQSAPVDSLGASVLALTCADVILSASEVFNCSSQTPSTHYVCGVDILSAGDPHTVDFMTGLVPGVPSVAQTISEQSAHNIAQAGTSVFLTLNRVKNIPFTIMCAFLIAIKGFELALRSGHLSAEEVDLFMQSVGYYRESLTRLRVFARVNRISSELDYVTSRLAVISSTN